MCLNIVFMDVMSSGLAEWTCVSVELLPPSWGYNMMAEAAHGTLLSTTQPLVSRIFILDFKGSALRILRANKCPFIVPFHYTFCLQSVSILRGVRKCSVMLCRELPGREFFMCSLCVAINSVRISDIFALGHQSHEHISRVSFFSSVAIASYWALASSFTKFVFLDHT
jgi:hypothetical protein